MSSAQEDLSSTGRCADLSAAAGIPLAGTATQEDRWLLVEHRQPWGRDAVSESGLPEAVVEALGRFAGRVLLVRRPGRAAGPLAVFGATTTEAGGELRRLDIARIEDLAVAEPLTDGVAVDGPLILVCTHKVRDACCGRRGVPVYNALRRHVPRGLLWRSSHLGGHRFAANVLALPHGILLGRVEPAAAAAVATALAEGRIPLGLYRGRTHHAPAAQAADAAVRRALGLDRVGDVRLLDRSGARVRLQTPRGIAAVEVRERAGPALPASCGAEPLTTAWLEATLAVRAGVEAHGR